jgi:hypothetical protein
VANDALTAPQYVLRIASGIAVFSLVVIATAWGFLALYYFDLDSLLLRTSLAALFGIFGCAVLVALWVPSSRGRALLAFLIVFAGLVIWWRTIAPSNDRHWKQGVDVPPYASIAGNLVTVHNIRNFHYRTESDFDVAYYDKTFDLERLDSVDLVASYWAGPSIAHIFLSFGFADGAQLAISIERRDEVGEDYSTIKGLFRQYELFYVVADERDVIRLRTNVRRDPPEEVYLYRLRGSREDARRVFLDYLREINSLRAKPEFYNTLTTNCTSNIWLHGRVNPGHVPYSWKILLSGYVPEYLYELGRLDTSVPFPELQRASRINDAAIAADDASDFSQRIRAGRH